MRSARSAKSTLMTRPSMPRGRVQPRSEVQQSVPTPDGPEEDHVLAAIEEAEREELLEAIAVEGHGRVPVEAFQGLLLLEAGALNAKRQVLLVAPVDLVLERELEELELTQFRLPRVRHPVGERREKARELQALHHGLEGLADLHAVSPWVRG